jgi:hypothetical protein
MPDLDLIKQGEHGARPARAVLLTIDRVIPPTGRVAAAIIRLGSTALNVLRLGLAEIKICSGWLPNRHVRCYVTHEAVG